MSSVAYPAQPAGPGWWRTAWLMFVGWLAAAFVLGGLYLAGTLVGAIGRNSDAAAAPHIHAFNDWPFTSNGRWSLFADVSVFLLAAGVTTIAIAWQLRGEFATVSEARLLVVLLLTSGAPYVTSDGSALVLFVIAVWVVRAWVVQDEVRFPRRPLLAIGLVLVLTIASYGILHPVWLESATTDTPVRNGPTVTLLLHNQGRSTVEIQQVNGGLPRPEAQVGWAWEEASSLPARIGPGQTQMFTLKLARGDCGGLAGRITYRVYGLTRSEPLSVAPSGYPDCS